MSSQSRTILFTRYHRERIDAASILNLEVTRGPLSKSEVIAALTRAVSRWVEECEAGREVWESSVGDLNIGDLSLYDAFDDQELLEFMRQEGLVFVSLSRIDFEEVPYDTLLARREE